MVNKHDIRMLEIKPLPQIFGVNAGAGGAFFVREALADQAVRQHGKKSDCSCCNDAGTYFGERSRCAWSKHSAQSNQRAQRKPAAENANVSRSQMATVFVGSG